MVPYSTNNIACSPLFAGHGRFWRDIFATSSINVVFSCVIVPGCRRPWHATSAASVSQLCKAQKVQLFSRKIDPVSDQWSTTASRRWFDVGPASPTLDQHRISGGLWYGVSLLDMNGRRGSAHVCVCGGGGGGCTGQPRIHFVPWASFCLIVQPASDAIVSGETGM